MTIDFNRERWEKVREDYRLWWARRLKRPLIHVTLTGCESDRSEPELSFYGFTTFYDLSISAERIVDRWDYDLSRMKFAGDAFPCILPDFGAGVLAAFLGAKLEHGAGTTWSHPKEDLEIADLHFEYNPENVWVRRIKDIYHAAAARWEGRVQLAMTGLGGNLDILSTFRPGEKLLLDLYDHPDEVQRLICETHEAWWRAFREFDQALAPVNPGCTCWTPIYSEESYYMLQCDFCYMIGPDMFDEFVKPELAASCRKLVNPFYHLDGRGQLPHLDSLLTIEELKGVQWFPGVGSPDISQWPEVLRKIHDAGKLIQFFDFQYEGGGLEILDLLTDQIGTAEGIVMVASVDISREKEVEALLSKYGVI